MFGQAQNHIKFVALLLYLSFIYIYPPLLYPYFIPSLYLHVALNGVASTAPLDVLPLGRMPGRHFWQHHGRRWEGKVSLWGMICRFIYIYTYIYIYVIQIYIYIHVLYYLLPTGHTKQSISYKLTWVDSKTCVVPFPISYSANVDDLILGGW